MVRSRPVRYDCCGATLVHFGDEFVEDEISKLQSVGPHVATSKLLDGLADCELRDVEMLEVGGGIGTITLEMLRKGVRRSTFVEISPAFLNAAATRARRAHCDERIHFVRADFVRIHAAIETADLVVMDRVICCYPDAELLMRAALSRCRQFFGLSYPKDSLASRLDTLVKNRRRRKKGNPFRTFVHSEKLVRSLVADAGFTLRSGTSSPLWRIEVHERCQGS